MDWNLILRIALFAAAAYALLRCFRSSAAGAGGCCGTSGHVHHDGHAQASVRGSGVHGDGKGRYYCPMHPEISSDDADATCPKCRGMKLQPRPAPKAENNPAS